MKRPRRVAIVTFPGGLSLDVVGPHEVFVGATQALRIAGAPDPGYAVSVVTVDGKPMKLSSGLTLVPDAALARLPRGLDTLIVAGGLGTAEAMGSVELTRAVAQAGRRARRVASVCTGTFVLAEAGLLAGRRVTTHWAHCAQLASAFPEVRVEPDPIYVRDGEVWTSAGVTAGMDLALAMVEDDVGRDVAMVVARHLVMFVRRAGGQSQFSALLAVQAAEREPLRDLQSWIADHPDAALDVPAMAQRAGMSVRHFTRVFRAQVGASPAAYVEKVRLETARRLLETTALPIERVADSAGFGTPESLRRAFHRGVGLTPREYRARFGARTNAPRGAS
jgi:transcriptional regulator GlxA family with amidase domain